MIGEMIVSDGPLVVSTILGSCVSVCLICPSKQAAGIIHYAFPQSTDNSQDPHELRYGNLAISALVQELKNLSGLSENSFVAKIVGGAWANNQDQTLNIGEENTQLARSELQKRGIKLLSEDVGGTQGRKIFFHLQSGRLQVSPL